MALHLLAGIETIRFRSQHTALHAEAQALS
jgi:hypothetical protein